MALTLAVTALPFTASAVDKKWPAAEIPGIYDCTHPHWSDTVIISYDGTYRRGSGDPGTWTYDGKTLTLTWKNWGAEPVTLEAPGKFTSNGLKMTKRGPPAWLPGTYDAVHPHWRGTLVINADGTLKNGNKPLEKWSFDGKTLVFHWSGYGPEPVVMLTEGSFADHGFTVIKQGAAAPVPAPAAVARDCGTGADDPGCNTQKEGAFAMDKDEFGGLMTALKAQRNEITRKEMALGSMENSFVTARQFGQIIALFNNELTRMEIVNERAARMVDPKRALGFSATFRNGITAGEYTAVINGLK